MSTNPSFATAYELVSQNGFGEVRYNKELDHRSFHALQAFMPGDIVCEFGAREVLDHPTYLTVQVDDNRHILLDPEFIQYTNHSCNPNVFFDTGTMLLVCLQPIRMGEELSFFYPGTEWRMDQPFTCHCGAKECLGQIQGAYYLSDEVLSGYRLTNYIRRKIAEHPNR